MSPRLAALLVALAALAACTTPTGDRRRRARRKDRVTASDQSEASRRANVRLQLASAYFADGQLTTALDEVKQAILADPKMGEAYNLRGLIYAGLGDDALAEESFRRALQLSPSDAAVMHNYGWYLCMQKRYGEASAQFQQALAQPQYRDVTRTLLAQGVCEARAGQLAEAERTLQRAYRPRRVEPGGGAQSVGGAVPARRVRAGALLHPSRQCVAAAGDGADAVARGADRVPRRQRRAANEIGQQLLSRFPKSPEASAFQQGKLSE